MNKGMMVFLGIGVIGMYFLIGFIGDIQGEDDQYKNNDYIIAHKYDKYKGVDSIGQDILDVTNAPHNVQLEAWNNSLLKDEFLDFFPAFDDMKFFITDRLKGDFLIEKLTSSLDMIEEQFFSGSITAEQAKQELGSLDEF